jgi:O-antigen ligase
MSARSVDLLAVLDSRAQGSAAQSSSRPGAILVIAVLGGMAAIAGLAIAIIVGMVDNRAIYYVAVLGIFAIGSLVTLTRKEPLRFAFLALIVCLPIAAAEVPPGRFMLTIFHAVMFSLMICGIVRQVTGSGRTFESFAPTRAIKIALVLMVPCIVFSQFPLWSLQEFVFRILIAYTFFLFALAELGREKAFERIVLLLSIVSMVLAAGLFVDHFIHMNLSLRGSNLNQVAISESGLSIYRAGGFFQDPQRAGAFLACMIAFLLLLNVRGRFSGMKLRFLVWAAIALSFAALVTTISRTAIMACLSVSAVMFFLFNKWNAVTKMLVMGSMIVLAGSMTMIPIQSWLRILPPTVVDRFAYMEEEFNHRLAIWVDTEDMFTDHPITGIGISSFRPYLMQTRPGVVNYYGIGSAEGVVYIPDQPESGYLKILYEGGILGSLAALTLAFDVVRRALAVVTSKASSADARTEMIAALAALATFGVTFVTLYTVSEERIAALFAIFVAVILSRSLQQERAAQNAKT